MGKSVLVWTYHRVLPEGGPGAVGVNVFEAQIAYLSAKGYRFLDTAGLEEWLDGKLDRSIPYTMISFDDGWADNFIYASPVLEKYKIRAVLALNTALAGAPEREGEFKITDYKEALRLAAYGIDKSSFLTWSELFKMKESSLWDIQAHGNSHFGSFQSLGKVRGFYPAFDHWTLEYALGAPPFLGAPRAEFRSSLSAPRTFPDEKFKELIKHAPDDEARFQICRELGAGALIAGETEPEFLKRIEEDFHSCSGIISDKLSIRPTSFFWPWGHYSPLSIKSALNCGYRMLFTMNKDAVTALARKDEIPRIAAPDSVGRFKKQERIFASPLLRRFRKLFMKKN
ncbi:MAG: hypothetical protein A2020_04365 [Lentisphaerae bacterium GWF2_45_14]|nr:MAG: hypothetical protein A2020_04365 [Lentisphaerae bacterium GWF2_45_14]